MAQGKFSSQVAPAVSIDRYTRTQRKLQQQEARRRAEFEAGKTEAERLQSEVFTETTRREEYQVPIPKRYLTKDGRPNSAWLRHSPYTRRDIIRHTRPQDMASYTATRTVTDPFTFEEYQQKYQKLSPNVQQFFVSPSTITTEQVKQKEFQKSLASAKVSQWQSTIERTREQMQRSENNYRNLTPEQRDRKRAKHLREMKRYELKIEEYQDKINYLQNEFDKLDEGYQARDIIKYANARAEAKRKEYESREPERQATALEKQGYTPFLIQKYEGTKPTELEVVYQKDGKSVKIADYKVRPKVDVSALKKYGYSTPSLQTIKIGKKDLKFDVNVPIYEKTGGGYVSSYGDIKYEDKYKGFDTSLTVGESTAPSDIASLPTTLSAKANEEAQDLQRAFSSDFFSKVGDFLATYVWKRKGKEASAPVGISSELSKQLEALPKEERERQISELKLSKSGEAYLTLKTDIDIARQSNWETISGEYTKKLQKLTGKELTQENINVLKEEAKQKWSELDKTLTESFTKQYTEKEKEIKREKEWWIEKNIPITKLITDPARQWWYKQEDLETPLKENKGGQKYFGLLTMPKIKSQSEAEKEYIQNVKKLSEMGYSDPTSRLLAKGKYQLEGFRAGVNVGIQEHPRTFVVKTGLWAGGTATVMVASTYTGGFGGVASSQLLKTAGISLAGLYGYTVLKRVYADKNVYQQGKVMGDIVAKELLPMGIGTMAGSYLGIKAVAGIDYAYYKWIKRYPYRTSYKIADINVLRGKKRFPTIEPHGRSAQLRKFKHQRADVLADELKAIKRGQKVESTWHGTENRMAFKKEKVMIRAKGKEINAMSLSADDLSTYFLRIGKKYYSFYSGQAVPTGNLPLGIRIKVKGFAKLPKYYKPVLTRTELQKILGYKINPKYFKTTAYLYEKGQFGTGYVAGIKSEVEAYLKGFGELKKTTQPAYYTQIAKPSHYLKLEGFYRKGYQEYAMRVPKFAITKPSTWIDKLLGRQAGQFKPMTAGRVVPLARFEALPQEVLVGEKSLALQIKEMVAKRGLKQDVAWNIKGMRWNLLTDKRGLLLPAQAGQGGVTSSYAPFTISASYPSSYAVQLLFPSYTPPSSRRKSIISPSYYTSPSSSSIGSISRLSYVAPSSVSRPSGISSSALRSSIISRAYYSPLSSYSAKSQRSFTLPRFDLGLKAKAKVRQRLQRTPDFYGLMPDFTARALGLAPKEVNVEQAMKEIQKIQTGFEIRRGARLKQLNEKDLMKGVMAW